MCSICYDLYVFNMYCNNDIYKNYNIKNVYVLRFIFIFHSMCLLTTLTHTSTHHNNNYIYNNKIRNLLAANASSGRPNGQPTAASQVSASARSMARSTSRWTQTGSTKWTTSTTTNGNKFLTKINLKNKNLYTLYYIYAKIPRKKKSYL